MTARLLLSTLPALAQAALAAARTGASGWRPRSPWARSLSATDALPPGAFAAFRTQLDISGIPDPATVMEAVTLSWQYEVAP